MTAKEIEKLKSELAHCIDMYQSEFIEWLHGDSLPSDIHDYALLGWLLERKLYPNPDPRALEIPF